MDFSKYPEIHTPRGSIIVTPEGKAELTWNANFKPKWWKKYSRAQKFVDKEVLRRCSPYVPLLTGMLEKSGILGTEIGSGTVRWIAPYARKQYYLVRKNPSKTGPLRGSYWFERMKQVFAGLIIKGARQIAAEEKA